MKEKHSAAVITLKSDHRNHKQVASFFVVEKNYNIAKLKRGHKNEVGVVKHDLPQQKVGVNATEKNVPVPP